MSNNFDQFIQEVESDLRQEKFEQLWKKYGKSVSVGFGVIVALSLSFNLWQHYQAKQRDIISQQFVNAQTLMFSKNVSDALSAMEGISKSSHRTYSTLAKLNVASILRMETGHKDLSKAETIYKELMENSSVEHMFRELATVQYVSLCLDKSTSSEELQSLLKLLDVCTKEAAPYRHLALELKGMIELKQKNYEKASEIFVAIAQDEKSPKDLRLRAQIIAQNLASQLIDQASKDHQ
ncbi:MAG: tetratricopeptide repeat protein [Pseudomonadota bacterium]|jgi:hypothetical protein|nr:tetratricopeptide repeat protein [Alphaproteobacteria bacterium]